MTVTIDYYRLILTDVVYWASNIVDGHYEVELRFSTIIDTETRAKIHKAFPEHLCGASDVRLPYSTLWITR
jgi:hypothetical protein